MTKTRVALPQFWEYLESELDKVLGRHRLHGSRRDFGTTPEHDVEGEHWFASGVDQLAEGDEES